MSRTPLLLGYDAARWHALRRHTGCVFHHGRMVSRFSAGAVREHRLLMEEMERHDDEVRAQAFASIGRCGGTGDLDCDVTYNGGVSFVRVTTT